MHKVAIIGAGIGAKHADGYAALPDCFQIHTICDLDAGRGRALADLHNAAFSAEFETVLALPEVNLIDICLPPHLHLRACLQALEAGKAVICEKPLVTSLADMDVLEAKAAETGTPVFPVFQYRFGLGMAQLQAVIAAGLAGELQVGTLETHWNRGTDYYALPWRGTWAGEQGGAVLGHAIHIHDLLTALTGPLRSVYARTATRVNPIEVEDCAALVLETAGGGLVTSSITLGSAQDTSRLKLIFEHLTVESDQSPYEPATAPWHFTARDPSNQGALDTVLAGVPEVQSGFEGFLADVAEAMASGGPGAVTLQNARRSLDLVSAVYESARRQVPVSLPLNSSHPLYHGWTP